jgi:hypothetical protein
MPISAENKQDYVCIYLHDFNHLLRIKIYFSTRSAFSFLLLLFFFIFCHIAFSFYFDTRVLKMPSNTIFLFLLLFFMVMLMALYYDNYLAKYGAKIIQKYSVLKSSWGDASRTKATSSI